MISQRRAEGNDFGGGIAQELGYILTPWLMEPGGSMPHSQGLSNNSLPESNQPNSQQ